MIIINLFVGSRYPIDRKKIRNRVKDVLQKNKIEEAQVDVSVVGQRKIKELNEKKLHHQGVTDVLSFPQCDKEHPKYKKRYKISKKYKVDDQKNEFKTGDKVTIQEVRPISKDKRWVALKKI